MEELVHCHRQMRIEHRATSRSLAPRSLKPFFLTIFFFDITNQISSRLRYVHKVAALARAKTAQRHSSAALGC